MNIEISNEMIEQMVQKEVAQRVEKWFAQPNNKYLIRECVDKAVISELRKFDYQKIANDAAKEKVNKAMMDKVCARISSDIAEAYSEKFGDY